MHSQRRIDLKTQHLDLDTAYLSGDLKEEVYMQQPQDFIKQDQVKKSVCWKSTLWIETGGTHMEYTIKWNFIFYRF